MKKLLSCLLGIVIVSSMLATASFAEGSSDGTTTYLSFGDKTNETKLTAAGWTYENFQKAGQDLNYAAKFQGGSPAGSITYSNLTGLAAGESLTFSAEIRMNDTSKSKFMITFTDSDGNSSYVVAGAKSDQTGTADLWTMNDTQKSNNNLQSVGTFGFESLKWSDKYTVRLKATNTIDILRGKDVLCKNVAIAADGSSSFDVSNIKTITIGAYGTQSENVTCIKNVSVTKEPCADERPDLTTEYTNDFNSYGGKGMLPDGFSNVAVGNASVVSSKDFTDEHGKAMQIGANSDSGAALVLAKLINTGKLEISWDEYADENAKPKFFFSSDVTTKEGPVSKVLNGISSGEYKADEVVRGWTKVEFIVDFDKKSITLKYGTQADRVWIEKDNKVWETGVAMLTFANGNAGNVCYDNLKIVHTGAKPEEPVFKVTGINKTNLQNAEVKYKNTTDQEKSGIAIAAYYKNGVLVNCEIIKAVTFEKSTENGTINVKFASVDKSKYDTSNVFLWDGTNNIKPLY